jgi:hypothetical protein
MSGESQLALAVCDAPHFDGAVIQPSDELPRVCRAELEAGDDMAAIFSNVSKLLYASPPLRGGEAQAKPSLLTVLPTQWQTSKRVPVAFQRHLARAR